MGHEWAKLFCYERKGCELKYSHLASVSNLTQSKLSRKASEGEKERKWTSKSQRNQRLITIFHTTEADTIWAELFTHPWEVTAEKDIMNVIRLYVSLTYKLPSPLKSSSLSSVIRLFCRSRNLVSGGIFFGTSVRPEDKTNKNTEGNHTPLNAPMDDCEPTP